MDERNKVRYVLEIYPPGNFMDVLAAIEAPVPFASVAVGDLINPRAWFGHYRDALERYCPGRKHGVVLRVTGLEHLISANGQSFFHKILIFTEALDDTEESRVKAFPPLTGA